MDPPRLDGGPRSGAGEVESVYVSDVILTALEDALVGVGAEGLLAQRMWQE